MNDLSRVRKRIKNRKSEESSEKAVRTSWTFKIIYRSMMVLMGMCVLVLSILLNQKLKWLSMPPFLQNFKLNQLSAWIPFDNWFEMSEQRVSGAPLYQQISNDQYRNDSNIVYNINDGIIMHIQQMKNNRSSISVKQDNGVIVLYSNVSDPQVHQEDRVKKGIRMATYQNYVGLQFRENSKASTYERAQQD